MVFCYCSLNGLRHPTLCQQLKLCKAQPLGTRLQEQKEKRVTCLGFDLIVQELLFKLGQSIVGAVIVQIQRVEDVPEEGKTTASSLLIISLSAGRFVPAWDIGSGG